MSTPQQVSMVSAPVTLLDVYTRQVEMGAQLAVIGEQLKAIPDHEQRIRLLESSKAKIYGGAISVSALISGLGTWIISGVMHH